MTIGRLTEQSAAGISPDRYRFKIYRLIIESVRYLRLKAIAEANRGDVEAARETLEAIRGWVNHYSNTETPYLMTTTMATSIRLILQSTIHSEILPLLAKGDIN